MKTPLYNKHLEAGGKMVNFAGFELPTHYSSQLEEHNIVRANCGVFDVSHMNIVDVSGVGTKDFMQKLIANDVAKLTIPYKALYGCMLNHKGGVVDDLIVYYIDNNKYRLVVNASIEKNNLKWMAEIAKDFDISLDHKSDLAMLAIQGPRAIEVFNKAMPGMGDMVDNLGVFFACAVGSLFIARTGYTGEDGLEIMLPAKSAPFTWQMLIDAGAKPCGLGARDTLRLEAGMNLYGKEMDENTSPMNAGLAWTIDLNDAQRDFIGKTNLGDKLYDLVGLILEDKGIMRSGQGIKCNTGSGFITSGGFSPSMKKSIALARLPLGAQGMCEVQMRHKWLKARIVKPNFVRHGKILV